MGKISVPMQLSSLERDRLTYLGGVSWVAVSATPDMSSEDPALQPPVLEPRWDGDGEGHPHSGMFETDRSVTQSRRRASRGPCNYMDHEGSDH